MQKVKLGIIGAGKIAAWHLKAYKRIPSVEIVAIANPFSNRGRKLAKKYSIKQHFSNGFDLIEQADIDAVDISVPTGLHKDFILRSLEKGINVYSEKPMGTSKQDIEDIIAANKKKKKVIFNGFNYRFLPEFCEIRAVIDSVKLGRIRYISMIRVIKERPDSYIFGSHGSGLFNEFHSHFVDLLFYFGFDNPEKVFAVGTTVHDWSMNPDTATILLSYPNKMVAEVTTSLASPGIAPEVFIIGTEGTLRLRYGSICVVKKRETWSLLSLIGLMFHEAITIPLKVLKNPFTWSCGHFIKCIRNGTPSECDEQSALKTSRVITAAEVSYRENRSISI